MNIEKLIQTANDGTSFRSALEDMMDEIRKGNVRKNMEEMREEIEDVFLSINPMLNENVYSLYNGNCFCLYVLYQFLSDLPILYQSFHQKDLDENAYLEILQIVAEYDFDGYYCSNNLKDTIIEIQMNEILSRLNLTFIEKLFGKKLAIFFKDTPGHQISSTLMTIAFSTVGYENGNLNEFFMMVEIIEMITNAIIMEIMNRCSDMEILEFVDIYQVETEEKLKKKLGKSINRYIVWNKVDRGMNEIFDLSRKKALFY